MSNNKLFATLFFVFSLALTGCDASGEDAGGSDLSSFAGEYKGVFNAGVTSTENDDSFSAGVIQVETLTVGANSLAAGGVIISPVMSSEGGNIAGGGSWVYITHLGNKIGLAASLATGKQIHLGAIYAQSAASSLNASGFSAQVVDPIITGSGNK
ncbi:MAG: hypothetical protein LBC53_01745 [Spirochaetaceae bacterium]|jgi:hypothetical protein|nr:hypothetical protein [Spirochaetaceae bacterium]